MHTTETKHKFIELRAKGLSLQRIADEINVARSTLIEWNHDFGIEIENLRQMELERLCEQLLGSEADRLQALARDYHRYSKELERREPGRVPQYMLFRIVCRLREQVERRVPTPKFTVPPTTPAAPAKEEQS